MDSTGARSKQIGGVEVECLQDVFECTTDKAVD
jgi:hypothetical protein